MHFGKIWSENLQWSQQADRIQCYTDWKDAASKRAWKRRNAKFARSCTCSLKITEVSLKHQVHVITLMNWSRMNRACQRPAPCSQHQDLFVCSAASGWSNVWRTRLPKVSKSHWQNSQPIHCEMPRADLETLWNTMGIFNSPGLL